MNKQPRISTPIVGGSSLLVIFAVLCLTVFSLLGLSTVQAGGRLSQSTVQAVSSYYQADCQAETIFARLRNGELPEGVVQNGRIYSYVCPISDTQQLNITLQKEADSWVVLRWQAESTVPWEADDTLNVWDGV